MTRHVGKAMVLGLGLAAAVGLAVSERAAAQQKSITLNMGHYLPDGAAVAGERRFAELVAERTNGRVKINIHWAGALGSATELLDLVGQGAIPMATTFPGYFNERLPFNRALTTAFILKDSDEQHATVKSVYNAFPMFRDELKRQGSRVLFFQYLAPFYLIGRQTDCTVQAFKGKKLRSFGAEMPRAISAIGAVPVTVLSPDSYEALQRGTLDYVLLTSLHVESLRLREIATHMCGPVTAYLGHFTLINEKTWNALPSDVQQVMEQTAAEVQDWYLGYVKEMDAKTLRDLQAKGMVIKSVEGLEQWYQAAPKFLDEWVAELTRAGRGKEARDIAQRWREVLGR